MSELGLLALSDSEFDSIRRLVLEHTGISLSESKKQLVKRRFTPRLKALGLGSFDDYVRYLRQDVRSELPHFCNAITTNLTSFFREGHHFDFLRQEALPDILRRNAARKRLRVWSAGCSTGEEAYCLAITLKQCIPDLSRWDVRILATDLDENCLETGRRGAYPALSMERTPAELVAKYFRPGEARVKGIAKPGYQAREDLRAMIAFRKLNLIHDWPMKGKFDIIFCRNVFIYFNKATQQRMVERFASYQEAGSYLCLGHSETIPEAPRLGYELTGKTIYKRRQQS